MIGDQRRSSLYSPSSRLHYTDGVNISHAWDEDVRNHSARREASSVNKREPPNHAFTNFQLSSWWMFHLIEGSDDSLASYYGYN